MKKIFISFVALMATMSLSAQTIVIYKVNKADNTESVADVYTNSSTYTYRAEFTNNSKHEFVDLGLPSGTLWARKNVGAEKETDTGLYFAWGETKGYAAGSHTFGWADYKWMTSGMSSFDGVTKYTFEDGTSNSCAWYDQGVYVGSTVDGVTYKNLTTLESTDDAATVNNGSIWRMPSVAEVKELENNTNYEWTSIDGVSGMKFTSKSDPSLYVFFPASGACVNAELRSLGGNADFWTNELSSQYTYKAFNGHLSKDVAEKVVFTIDEGDRCCGVPIRAIVSKSK